MRVGRPLAAVAVTALALAGCSSGGGTTPAQSGESTESSGSGGTQEIILLAYQSETVMQTVVDAFNESQSDVHVTVQTSEPTDGGSYAQALQTRVAGNQAPDIFNIVAENRTDVLQHDLAMDLTGMPVVDTVPGSYLDLYRKDGGVYGVTFTAWMGLSPSRTLSDEVERFKFLVAPHKKTHADGNKGEQDDDPDRGGQGFGYGQVWVGSCDAERHQRSGCEDEDRHGPAQQPACLLLDSGEVAGLCHRNGWPRPVQLGGDLNRYSTRVPKECRDFLHIAELGERLANGLVLSLTC